MTGTIERAASSAQQIGWSGMTTSGATRVAFFFFFCAGPFAAFVRCDRSGIVPTALRPAARLSRRPNAR